MRIGIIVSKPATPLFLIVEDEPLIAMMLEAQLRDLGIEPVAVRTSAEARQALDARPVDAAILDYHLVEETTAEFAAQLQALGVPFAMCSGSVGHDMAAQCPDVDLLAKPYSDEALSGVVRTLLARAAERKSASAA
jgi:CheY-like chemotaxis protein